MMADDKYARAMNSVLYGAPPSQEVTIDEAWDYLVTDHPEAPGHYYRGHGFRVRKDRIIIRRDKHEWVPNEKAIDELRALMQKWRARGWSNVVDSVEIHHCDDDEYKVYESLGHTKATPMYIKVPLSGVKFYKVLPYDVGKGLQQIVEPMRNARLVGLGTSNISLE